MMLVYGDQGPVPYCARKNLHSKEHWQCSWLKKVLKQMVFYGSVKDFVSSFFLEETCRFCGVTDHLAVDFLQCFLLV